MNTKRLILMLLVTLMTVTGVWAGDVKTQFTTISNDFEKQGYSQICNNDHGTMVIMTGTAIDISRLNITVNYLENMPERVVIEASNNQSEWNTLKEQALSWGLSTSLSVPVTATQKYQYFRITFSRSSIPIEFRNLEVFEDILSGDGTPQNPYLLDKPIYLKKYAEIVAAGNNAVCAKLTKNLDVSGIDLTSIDNADFVGTIDGDGHSIKNLNNANGLFKNIGAATIKNLTIENATLSATDEYCGVLASQANGTTFQNCTVTGTVSASSATTGGLVGNATGCTFTDCHVSGLFVTGTTAGGLAGRACNGTTFTNCMVSGLTSNNAVKAGGIVGLTTNDVSFTACYSAGNFTVGSANAGALVGNAQGNTTFSQCYAVTNLNDEDGVHLPVCGSSDGSCTANLCYHYGSTSSAMSTSVEKTDVASGRLAYLLNDGIITGPYFQRIGTDAYPHRTNTGDNYVYLAFDDVSYTNACPHRDCTIYPFKAPSCLGTQGNAEYGKCHNSLCGKYFPTSNRNAVTTSVKDLILCSKAVKIQDHSWNNYGLWNYSTSKNKDGIIYYNVMEVSLQRNSTVHGNYEISYTTMDDDPTLNLHLFFSANMGVGNAFTVRFYVNGAERTALRKDYPSSISEQHEIVAFDGLHKFDCLKVVFNYGYKGPAEYEVAHLFVGTEKALPTRHNDLQKHEFNYNCIDGGYQEYYGCDRCTNVFTQNTPESDGNITTLSDLALAPVGSHNFATRQVEGNLYGDQCQNQYCTTFDPEKYVLRKYNNDDDMPLLYDGNTYTAKAPVSLTDAKEYVTPVAFSAADMAYARTFYPNVWNPWFVPFTATVEELADNGITDVACIESIHNYDTDDDGVVDKTVLEVIKKKNGTMKAGVPYLVRTGDSYTYPMAFTDRVMDASTNVKTLHSETISAAYDFMGTYSGLTAEEVTAASIFSLNSNGAMVHRTGKILPQRWYMKEVAKENVYEELSPAMARAISIRVIGEEDESTGIRTIYPEDEQKEELLPEGIFDLSGRKLSAPQPGKINIINGKKQYVK